MPSFPEIVSNKAQRIQNPFYPDYYTNNQDCKWLVIASSNQIVSVMLTRLDLAQGDFLEVRDGKDETAAVLTNLSSKTRLPDGLRRSSGRFLWVRFKSDHQYVGKGFSMLLVFQPGIISKYTFI